MKIKKLNTPLTHIDKIFHISDIHIRTLKRHTEYTEVFDNMFLYLAQHATRNSICVLTGDIVHSKLDMSPELINMLTKFFIGFDMPTIVMLGNHDMNLNNLYRMDALSPILDVIQNPNIHFIKENGLYEMAGIVFNHMAVDVAPDKYIKAKDFDAPYKIALHHGAVHNAKTDIGFEISNEHVTTDLFKGHDLTLLGDIHKPAQFLNTEKTIGYPGSLIQQNHGEALDHGILVWDIPDRSAEFVEIQNDYGYVTFEVDKSKIVKSPHRVPNKPRVRIKFNETDASDIKKLIATLRKKYKVQDISIQRDTNQIEYNQNGSIAIGNVRDVEYQNNLITQYIEDNHPEADKKEIDAIRYINRTINSKLPVLESIRNVTWHPVSFEFDNMFSYGENNKVEFDKLSDVIGLFAANASGKSSLLDAITYTIFDKCSKTSKSKEVLNNKKSSFRGVFKFKLNNKLYTIEREGITLKHGHVKVNVNFYTEDENLNGEERSDTNKSIRRYLGTYDDFILTAFSLQADNNNFIEKSQRERKDLLSQFLDTTVFEQLYQLASEEIKETSGKLKEYKKTDFGSIIKESDDIITENQDTIVLLEKTDIDLQESRNTLQNDIVEIIESKQPTSYDGPDIEEQKEIQEDLEDTIDELHRDIETHELTVDELNSELTSGRDFDYQSIVTVWNEKKLPVNKLIQGYTQKITESKQSIKYLQEKVDHLNTHEYDPNCKYCISNIFVKEAALAKIQIPKLQETLETNQTELNQQILDLENIQGNIDEYQLLVNTKNKLENRELQLQVLESELQTKESELENNLEKQELFKKNESAIIHNKSVDTKIQNKKLLIADIAIALKDITDTVKSNYGEIEVAKTKKKTAIEQLETYKQLETEYKAYEYYLRSVKRDGVPYELIKTALPKIEAEINNVLNQVVDFNMVLNTDGKNINGYIIYDEDSFWPLELTSGMERFISSLAIRVALINVSALPRPNFIAIDEGWGSLDQDHIASVANLFDYFRTKFDFTIIISHVDSMRDMVDNLMEVNKIDNFSHIVHT
jgi:DNA repair exonuclease SbcCD ATPase subunit